MSQVNEQRIALLNSIVAQKARELIRRVESEGISILITQGLRSIAEQNELYAQGRTKPGPIVTNARGDTAITTTDWRLISLINPDGSFNWNVDARWRRVAEIGKTLGFAWGRDWTGFVDYPHLEFTFDLSINDLLMGKRPAEENEGDEETMKEIEELKGQIQTLLNTAEAHIEKINALEMKASMAVPEWANPAVDAAVRCNLIDSPDGRSHDFYSLLTVFHRKGII
ncbi:M15 family metallopeptidase [Paenibacillus aceris]|uniref:Peptidase M15C domain-containing protein n=1 Tax=Paenibacillus aceris TaxID=869555 RepID=A0ABS4HRC2_9BACL|nr:M15 family metallopeptidase [Paenibacillus aceris]MBP1961162.1 hypothetical protein [Paenibacillus aceris]